MGYRNFGEYQGREVKLFILKSDTAEVGLLDFGARIHYIKINGTEVTLGYKSAEAYAERGGYAGASVGRVGNRIKGGKFTLGGREYEVGRNEGNNSLHGGKVGFDKKFFDAEERGDNRIVFSYLSPDGEEGYPGNLSFKVTYTLNGSSLKTEFEAVCDKDTLFAPTNHVYFDFDAGVNGNCLKNLLEINADKYLTVDGELIPTGIASVAGTPFDFNGLKEIGRDFSAEDLSATGGYDHNYFLNGSKAAHAESAETGVYMDLYTNLPCMQFYSGGAMRKTEGRLREYDRLSGFCLEPQFCPDAMNVDGVKKPVLLKGETARYYVEYKFGFKK